MKTVTTSESGVTSAFDVHEFGSGHPRIIFTGGIHGNEFGGIYVAQRLIQLFQQAPPLKGSVAVIPWCNPAASRCGQRRSPFDGEDMNRIFPGAQGGSISHRVAAALWEETADADYIVDLHCCGQHGTPYILATYEEHQKARQLASLITTIPVVIRSEGTPGQLFTNSSRDRGQAALIIEIPSGPGTGAINIEATDMAYAGLVDMLKALGFVAGQPQGQAPAFYGPLQDAELPAPGLWQPEVAKRTRAQKGQVIGRVGGQEVLMPEDGYIMAVRPKGYAFPDDLWAAIYTVGPRD